MRRIDIAEASGKHDRLVIATEHTAHVRFEGAEVAAEIGPPELVVERGGADRSLEHDVERRSEAAGLAGRGALPDLLVARNAQIGDRVADEAGLRLCAAAGRAFVADLAAGTGRGARERRDGGGMVVRLHLHDGVHRDGMARVTAVTARMEALRLAAFHDRGVVGIRDDGARRIGRMRVADHGEERLGLRLAVDDPVGVEDLVAAVLRVRLREHGELGVGGVAPHGAVGALEISDLVGAQRQAEPRIRLPQLGDGNPLERPRRHALEEPRRVVERREHGLGHAIVQQRGDAGLARVNGECGAALDAPDRGEAAVSRDVGRLGRPGGDSAQARHDQVNGAARRPCAALTIGEQPLEQRALLRDERALGLDEMPELGADGADGRIDSL